MKMKIRDNARRSAGVLNGCDLAMVDGGFTQAPPAASGGYQYSSPPPGSQSPPPSGSQNGAPPPQQGGQPPPGGQQQPPPESNRPKFGGGPADMYRAALLEKMGLPPPAQFSFL